MLRSANSLTQTAEVCILPIPSEWESDAARLIDQPNTAGIGRGNYGIEWRNVETQHVVDVTRMECAIAARWISISKAPPVTYKAANYS